LWARLGRKKLDIFEALALVRNGFRFDLNSIVAGETQRRVNSIRQISVRKDDVQRRQENQN
jgi:hypothetical protein